ncbi:ArsR family transcriptional regulator [Altericroceibacterium spongiae]|uniref:ArsR family transcriptional regulator n=1 Tax=Altericroceibacterium spongiae TaxID=2320269 RepID=A0A420EFC6_9SPHN|nr:winged helix-turn-helix domain-containing protein [Altericroceibacterium spongiae]RKF19370.1 ArsR family transcriptional regulator [Altericroceibacterium spongiae]
MREGPDIARIASLIGDPARANMLTALMSGKALTASELAQEAGVTLQTASSHLAKLTDGGLLRLRKQGRHRYFALAHDDVAHVLENLMGLAVSAGHLRMRTGPKDGALRKARICYNHLAGDMGTRMFDSLMTQRHLELNEKGIDLSESGVALMQHLGIDLAALRAKRSALCRECLDWSERRTHLAGSLGRALLERFEQAGWASRDANSRAVHFTRRGEKAFREAFSIAEP